MQRFLAELQRRKVLRLAAAYIVGAWIVLQVALALQTAMSLSGQFSAAILAVLVIGFFVAVVLSWFYEITPEGVKRTALATDDAPLVKPQTTDLILASALALVLAAGVAQFLWSQDVTREAGATSAVPTTTDAAQKPAIEPPKLGDKSIAVLPFANLSPDKENEYFADGLTEELLNLLAKIGDLKVISRTSSFAFKGKNTPLPEIARALGVKHVLEGSVRSEGDDLRVTAQLIDVVTDTHLWSQTYERKVEGVFNLQDELARDIAAAMKVEIALGSPRGAPTKNLKAYRSYLEGLNAYRNRDETNAAATELFKKAVTEDPQFAEAHAMLSAAYVTQSDIAGRIDPNLDTLARAAATRAIELKPTLGLGYAVLARLDRRANDWEAGVANADRAYSLDPTDSYTKFWRGSILLGTGRIEAARTQFLELLQTDPFFDPGLAQLMIAEASRANYDRAEELAAVLTKSKDVVSRINAHAYLAIAAVIRRDGVNAAKHYLEALLPKLRDRPFALEVVAALRDPKLRPAAIAKLKASIETPGDVLGLVLLGGYDAVLDFTAAQPPGRPIGGSFIWHPRFRVILNDARWKKYVRARGLVDYWKSHGWPDRCRPKGEDDFECS